MERGALVCVGVQERGRPLDPTSFSTIDTSLCYLCFRCIVLKTRHRSRGEPTHSTVRVLPGSSSPSPASSAADSWPEHRPLRTPHPPAAARLVGVLEAR
jgi:hypothetical protein